jgi:cytochrome c oxidase assembly protein Cox11
LSRISFLILRASLTRETGRTDQVAPYFAKVECFCFDEQKILAGEEVDLPVFFFIDRDFVEDPLMKDVDDIVLSYTFLYVYLISLSAAPSIYR